MAREKQVTMVTATTAAAGSNGVENDPALQETDCSTTENPKDKGIQRQMALLEENQALERRLQELRDLLHQTHKETSLVKMKSIMTVGSIKLEIDSLNEDRQFLIQKYHGLKRKVEGHRNDLKDKEDQLEALKIERRERTHSI